MIRASESGTGWMPWLLAMGAAGLLISMSGSAFAQGFDAFSTQHDHDTPDRTCLPESSTDISSRAIRTTAETPRGIPRASCSPTASR